LGSVRAIASDTSNDGRIRVDTANNYDEYEVLAIFNYYPFGMEMDGPWKRATSGDERYLYNGKEVVDNGSLRWHDYGARCVDPKADAFAGWSPYSYGLNNPIIMIDPGGDSTRVYNSIGEHQFTINDNLPNQDHFFSQEQLDALGTSCCSDPNERAQMYRDGSDFFIGANTREQLASIQSSTAGEEGFVLYPGESGELQVYDITHLGSSSSHQFRINPDDVKQSLHPGLYSSLVGAGHGQPTDSSPSPPLFGRLSDYSPMLHYSSGKQPAHLSVVAGPKDFTIYSSAQRTYINNVGWTTSYPGRTSTRIKYNGNSN
jgi:hypothetical protein